MTFKRFLGCVFILFVLFFIISDPVRAADVTTSGVCLLKHGASKAGAYIGELMAS